MQNYEVQTQFLREYRYPINPPFGNRGLFPTASPVTIATRGGAGGCNNVLGYGISQIQKSIGAISTRNFSYAVAGDFKLSSIISSRTTPEEYMKRVQEYDWPKARIDTNAAYLLATQWLAALSVDVAGLRRDCKVRVVPDRYWNKAARKGRFVPIYDVSWLSPQNLKDGHGDAAMISLFLPTKDLLTLCLSDPKYVLRKPLVCTNLEALLSGTRTVWPHSR